VLQAPRNLLLWGLIVAVCVSAFTIPFSGWLSDVIGRKRMYIIGCAAMGLFGFVYFGMINTGSSVMIFIAMVLSLIPHDMQYGPQAALIAESFTPRLRYSGPACFLKDYTGKDVSAEYDGV
jgi:MFS family permease